jgi:hypothetical protein
LEQFQQPRAAQQSYGYRQTPPYPSFPMQSSPGNAKFSLTYYV